MPVCFGLEEFAIVKDFRCDCPKEPLIKETPPERSKASRTAKPPPSNRRKYKEKLRLVWFSYAFILARDINKVIEDDMLKPADDFEKFNNYPWGYENYYLIVKYLLTKLSSKTITSYRFSWAFMAWAFKVISPLQKQVKDYPDEVSHVSKDP
ncbi:hypothetical protein FXO38_18357 [Capsicum annuum]|nr:hypothetical protein FXO38_18357 [Capsicum annuum]